MSSRWTQLAKGARISDHLKALRTDFVVSLDSHIDWFTEYSHYDLTKESMRRLQYIYQVVKKNVTQETCSKSVKTKDIFLKIDDSLAE